MITIKHESISLERLDSIEVMARYKRPKTDDAAAKRYRVGRLLHNMRCSDLNGALVLIATMLQITFPDKIFMVCELYLDPDESEEYADYERVVGIECKKKNQDYYHRFGTVGLIKNTVIVRI